MRRPRESKALRHGTPPLIVHEMDPIDDHPGLGPLTRRKIKKVVGKVRGKAQAKVKVEVDVKAGGKDGP